MTINTKRILTAPIRFSIGVLLLAMLGRALQWPYSGTIMLTAFSAIGILYGARFWKKSEKRFIDYVKLILVVFWTTNGILNILHFPYTLVFQIVIAVSFLIWFIMEGTAYFLDEDRKERNNLSQILWNCVMVGGTLAIICGSLLMVLQWDYALVVILGGVAVVFAYIVKDVFSVKAIEEEDRSNEEFQL